VLETKTEGALRSIRGRRDVDVWSGWMLDSPQRQFGGHCECCRGCRGGSCWVVGVDVRDVQMYSASRAVQSDQTMVGSQDGLVAGDATRGRRRTLSRLRESGGFAFAPNSLASINTSSSLFTTSHSSHVFITRCCA